MNISIEYGTENIYWKALCEVFRLAPLGIREPDKLTNKELAMKFDERKWKVIQKHLGYSNDDGLCG